MNNNLPPFQRHEENGIVAYEILSSTGGFYYHVELLAGKTMCCECADRQHQPTCQHGDIAEKEEAIYQASLQAYSTIATPCKGTLNDSNKGFTVLRN